MVDDKLNLRDIEQAVLHGKLTRKEKDDLRGTKYIIIGKSIDPQITVGIVGRFTETGRFLIITVYEIKDL